MKPRYDAIADFYVESAGNVIDDPVGMSLLGASGGRWTRDPGSGLRPRTHDAGARAMGAAVVGLDISAPLLDRAREAGSSEGLQIKWVEGDATSAIVLEGEVFDGVVSHFGLSDVDELDPLLATVGRVLRPGGWFAFSILHPCFPGWGDDAPSSWRPGSGYFQEGWWRAENTGFRGRVGSTHRTLSTYVNALFDHVLQLVRMVEPRPTGPWLRKKLSDDLVPTYLVVLCSKT